MANDERLRAGRREWIGLAVLALACVVYAMDLTVLHLAVPSLSADLKPSSAQLLWIIDMFHDQSQRTFAIGVWITSYSLGGAIGPLLGGALLEFFWWGSVFLLAVPVMALLLVLGPVLLPEFRDPEAGRLDLLSAALSLVAVLTVVFGLKRIAQDGLGWLAILAILAGLAVGIAFVRRQTRLADPLIDLRLFRVRAFSASLVVYTLGILVLFGAFLFIFQYLQLVAGLSPFRAGLWTLPSFGSFILGSMLAPAFVRRVPPGHVMAVGLAVGAAGFALLTQVRADSGLAVLVSASVIFSLGLAPLFTLTNDLILGAAPPERAGAASAISETGAELGGALSIAILGTLGTAVYRTQVADGVPARVPPEQEETARDTLGGAVAAAEGLPNDVAAELLEVTREAFTQGLQVSALASAVVATATAGLAAVLLRNVRAGSDDESSRNAPVPTAAVELE